VAPEALEYILDLDTPLETVKSVLIADKTGKHPSVLSRPYVESLIKGQISDTVSKEEIETPIEELETSPLVFDEATKWSFRIEKNPDPKQVGSEGLVEDFLALFRDRFNRIKRIYMSRIDTANAVSPQIAKLRKDSAKQRKALTKEGMRTSQRTTQTVLGIVKNKSISQSRNVVIELEDIEESIICIVPATREGLKGQQLSEKANSLLLDEITCISGFVDEDARMIADDVIFPDIPTAREIGRAKRDGYAVFISDIHCGSKEFLEDEFDKFIGWMNGRDVDEEDKTIVKQIRYLFIAGDMVDGIRVYP